MNLLKASITAGSLVLAGCSAFFGKRSDSPLFEEEPPEPGGKGTFFVGFHHICDAPLENPTKNLKCREDQFQLLLNNEAAKRNACRPVMRDETVSLQLKGMASLFKRYEVICRLDQPMKVGIPLFDAIPELMIRFGVTTKGTRQLKAPAGEIVLENLLQPDRPANDFCLYFIVQRRNQEEPLGHLACRTTE